MILRLVDPSLALISHHLIPAHSRVRAFADWLAFAFPETAMQGKAQPSLTAIALLR